MSVLSVIDEAGETIGEEFGGQCAAELIAARAKLAEFIESARAVNEYLGGFPMYRDAVYRSPAAALRKQADDLERKEAAIARFRSALLALNA